MKRIVQLNNDSERLESGYHAIGASELPSTPSRVALAAATFGPAHEDFDTKLSVRRARRFDRKAARAAERAVRASLVVALRMLNAALLDPATGTRDPELRSGVFDSFGSVSELENVADTGVLATESQGVADRARTAGVAESLCDAVAVASVAATEAAAAHVAATAADTSAQDELEVSRADWDRAWRRFVRVVRAEVEPREEGVYLLVHVSRNPKEASAGEADDDAPSSEEGATPEEEPSADASEPTAAR